MAISVEHVYRGLGGLAYRLLTLFEHGVKKPVFGCQMCGQCALSKTGLVCPMRCPKTLRNGSCGGPVNGRCEVYPDRPCVWVEIYESSSRLGWTDRLQAVQWPVNWSLQGTSSWINFLTKKDRPPAHARLGQPRLIASRASPSELVAGSNLERVLRAGEFAVTSELGPPKSASATAVQRKAALLRGYVDAVNVTDNQRAVVHLSSLAGSILALQEGVEPVYQLTARDRNRIALQSDLLGASSLGVRNVLLLTGDHQRHGNHPEAKGVFDLDSTQMALTARRMRDEGLLLSGDSLKTKPRLFIGVAAHPGLEPLELELLRLEKKIDAGADFVQTQGVFDLERFERWMAAVRQRGLHQRAFILAGVLLIRSTRAAEVMKREVPGLYLPDSIYRCIVAAPDPEQEGLKLGIELVQALRQVEGVRGVHLMAIGWEEAIPHVVEGAGLLPRPRLLEGVERAA